MTDVTKLECDLSTYTGRLIYAADRSGKTNMSALAREIGDITPQAIQYLMTPGNHATGSKHTPKLARAHGVRPEWLADGTLPMRAPEAGADPNRVAEDDSPAYVGPAMARRRVPVVGTAKLGDNGYYDELSDIPGAGDGYLETLSRDENAYALRIRGQSMFPAIRDGWYVIIEPNGTTHPGEYVLLKLRNGKKMVKELMYRRNDSVEVLSVNGGERHIFYWDEIEALQPVGAVIQPSKWKPEHY